MRRRAPFAGRLLVDASVGILWLSLGTTAGLLVGWFLVTSLAGGAVLGSATLGPRALGLLLLPTILGAWLGGWWVVRAWVRARHAVRLAETERHRTTSELGETERHTRAILASAVDAIITIDETGLIRSINPAAERMFGYVSEELIGQDVQVLMPSPYREEHPGYLSAYRETGRQRIIGIGREVTARRKGGATFPADLAVSEVRIGDDRAFIGTLRDITVRKRTEAELRRQRDFAERLIETARALVLVLDSKGTLLRTNHYFEELTGTSREQAEGLDWFESFVPGDDRRGARQDLLAARAGEPVLAQVHRIKVAGDGERTIEWYATRLDDPGAEGAGVLAVGLDITERERLEEQVRSAQKMEAIGRLAGGIAHDFNTLLGSIIGYGELIRDGLPAEAPESRHAEQILRGAHRGAALTRQLLAFGRRQVLRPRVVDLNEIVRGMEDMLSRLIGDHIELEIRLDEGATRVRVDQTQIEQVLLNLVLNARDALEGGGSLTVTTGRLSLETPRVASGMPLAAGPYVVLDVRDEGAGMDLATRERLFEPFFTSKPLGEGTGLGLATVYGIVQQSGGGIEVESALGSGSTFRILLPAAASRDEVEATGGGEVEASDAPRRGRRGRVLLVEDDTMFRELLAEILEDQGFDVSASEGPAEALEQARRAGRVDLVVTDLVMAGMSGTELLRRLQRDQDDLPAILMSGYADRDLEAEAAEARATFLHKPFAPGDLLRAIDALLADRAS